MPGTTPQPTRWDATLFVAAPRPAVFAYLADPAHRPEWQASLKRVDLLDPGPPHVGQRWVDHLRGGASFELRITELVPDEVWAEQGRTGPVDAEVTLLFADAVRDGRAGTEVRILARVRGRRAAKPLGWAATAVMAGLVRVDLPRVARILEGR